MPTIIFELLHFHGVNMIRIDSNECEQRQHDAFACMCLCVMPLLLLLLLMLEFSHSLSYFILFAPTSDEHTFCVYVCMPNHSPSSASHGIRSLHWLAFSLAPFHSSFYVSVGIRSVRRHSIHISCSCMTIHIRIVCMCMYRCLMRSANSRRIYVCG